MKRRDFLRFASGAWVLAALSAGCAKIGLGRAEGGKGKISDRLKAKRSQVGPCGIYCGACPAIECDGCQSARVADWAMGCKFRKCAKAKEVEFCFSCGDYPCKDLHAFMRDKWPHHWPMEQSLEDIKKHGVEKWLKVRRKEWTCGGCGAATFWYQKKCGCGQDLKAWVDPEP